MTNPVKTPILENWFIALLLSLALGLCSLTSQQAFADEASGDAQSEEQTDESEDDDDSEDEDDGDPKGNKGKNKSGDDADETAEGGKPHCQKSAQYLFLACQHRTKAEHWERLAECENMLEKEQRHSCFKQSRQLNAGDKHSCKSERVSRRGVCEEVGREVYQGWDGVDFVGADDDGLSIVGNDYFPLLALTSIYLGFETRVDREVTDTAREIDGVTCKVVIEEERDTTEADPGILWERVERLYAQDIDSNIWTCGVLRQQYGVLVEGEDPVVVSTEGSWEAGSEGALAGIAMRSPPAFGDIDRRSYAPGIDEDLAEVIDPETVTSAFLCGGDGLGDCVILRITSPLSPGGYRDEYYQNGVGLVHSENQDGEDALDIQP